MGKMYPFRDGVKGKKRACQPVLTRTRTESNPNTQLGKTIYCVGQFFLVFICNILAHPPYHV